MFWSGRKLFEPPQAGRISCHFTIYGEFGENAMRELSVFKEEKRLSKSEEKFFYKPQELKKVFFKSIEKNI